MRARHFKVIEEYLPKGTIVGNPMYTPAQFNDDLGRASHLGIHVVLDNITAHTADRYFVCFVEQSGDGRNWLQRTNPVAPNGSGDAEVKLTVTGSSPGPASVLVQGMWSDACQKISKGTATASYEGPLLTFVRLKMFFEDANVAGHVTVHVTQRNN